MRLRADLCLVKLAPHVTRTASGLHLADALPPPVCYGKVTQTGAKVRDIATGDLVVFPPSVGESLEGYFVTPHLLIPERDISAVLEKDIPA
jgi:hypothetical protein